MKPYPRALVTVLVTIIVVLIAEVCIALAAMWWGVVYIGADRPHPQPIRWYLDNTMERSVKRHARGLKAPARAQVSVAEGARHYSDMCAICHAAPGVERSEISKGLSPDPPLLARTADDWTVEQVYWLATHGVGDTGMPAFGPSRTEQQRWAIAYFVKQLPHLTPEEFRKLVAGDTSQGRQP
jgi:mono/diheme cytochrome c family protein